MSPYPYAVNATRFNGKAGWLSPRDLVAFDENVPYSGIVRTSRPAITIAPFADSGADFDLGTDPVSSGLLPAIQAVGTTGQPIVAYPGNYYVKESLAVSSPGVTICSLGAANPGPGGSSAPTLPTGQVNIIDARPASSGHFLTVTAGGFALRDVWFYTENAQAGYAQLDLSSVSGAYIRDCSFTGNYQSDICIEMDTCQNVYVTGSSVGYCNADAIYVNGIGSAGVVQISGNDIRRWGHGGSMTGGVHLSDAVAGPVWIDHNNMEGGSLTTNAVLYMDASVGTNGTVFVDNNVATGGLYNFYIHGTAGHGNQQLYVSNCVFESATGNGIYMDGECDQLVFTGCTVRGAAQDGVLFNYGQHNQDGFTFSGCQFLANGSGSPGTYSGINIAAPIVVYLTGCFFGESTTSSAQAYGVNFSGSTAALANGTYQIVGCAFGPTLTAPFENLANILLGSTLIVDCPGFNPTGWNATGITISGSGTYYQNPNPYPCEVYVTNIGSGVSAYTVKDLYTNVETFSVSPLATGRLVTLGMGERIAFTYSTIPPTLALKGL